MKKIVATIIVAVIALIGVLSVLFWAKPSQQEESQIALTTLSQSTLARYPDFTISQTIQNGVSYYQLSIEESEDYLLLNEAQTELTLYSGSKTLTLPIATLFGNETAAPATLALQDLTQDGVAELVFLHEDGGTGALDTTVHIVERTTMTEYTLPDVVAALAPTVSLAPTSIITSGDTTYVWCDLYADYSAAIDVVIQPFEILPLESYQYDPDAQTGSWIQIALTEDGLQCTVGLQVEHQVPWEYFCTVTSDIVYDPATQQFVMGENRNVVTMDTTLSYEASTIDRATPRDAYTTWQADLTNDGQSETIFFDPATFEEIGMTEPFTATTTYGDKVAASYAEHPEAFIGMSYSLGWNDEYLAIGDAAGNEIKVGVVAHDASGTERPEFTDSTGMLNEVYWNGVYQGDLPGSSDAIMVDFYAYDTFMLMVDSAHYMPQDTNLQVTVDSTTVGNNKKISSVAYALYSPNGTVLERGEVDNTTAQDGVVTLEIPALDYHGEDVVIVQVTIHLTDATTEDPENRIVFSMPCRAQE